MNQFEQFMFLNTLHQKENNYPQLQKLRKLLHISQGEILEQVPILLEQGYRPEDPFKNWSPKKEDREKNMEYFDREIQKSLQQGKRPRQMKVETYLNLLCSDQVNLKQLKPVARYWEQKFTVIKKLCATERIYARRLQKQIRGNYRKLKQM